MIELTESQTIGAVLREAAQRFGDAPFLMTPVNPDRSWAPAGESRSFGQMDAIVAALAARYADAGYGAGHRIGLLLENRLAHFEHKLALNTIGACCVPLNPDHRPAEMGYVIGHARVDLVVVLPALAPLLREAVALSGHRPPVVALDDVVGRLPAAGRRAAATTPEPSSIATVLYTSGTTGRPKGCLLSHRYELASGHWYATRGGQMTFREAAERIYNPLPVYHVNSSVVSFYGALFTGNCQVQADRFQTSRWWQEVKESDATVIHYLGVIVPMLLNQPAGGADRDHQVRFGIGAGVDPQRHAEFEARFGFPLVEIWGMTETVRLLVDAYPPRRVGTRAFGKAQPGLEARVVDDNDTDVADGVPGEMVVRHSQATPRQDAFSGYLDDEAATEAAWRGGWFHTGDIVVRDPDGMLHFVERRKNIIRRAGENIAAAEVEAVLQSHPDVVQAAVLPVPDEVREEEVLACIVVRHGLAPTPGEGDPLVRKLFEYCNARLAYYKAPGWIYFVDEIPTTGTQKVQKHQIFAAGIDPRTRPGMIDLRHWKKRQPTAGADTR
jgi:crotonobetaine/carnitine-CoA ligase